MNLDTFSMTLAALSFAAVTACDGDRTSDEVAAAPSAGAADEAGSTPVGGKLAALNTTLKTGAPFDEVLARVEAKMGKSPLQQGEFWNFGEYDSSGACLHMVLVRSGDKVQQVQFAKYEPGSSGFGWCAELKIERS